MTVTREQIAAYADGELSGEELARVEAAIAADPALAKEVASHRLLKATLGSHFAPILDAPVPERLTEAARGGAGGGAAEVVDFAAERDKRQERRSGVSRRSVPRWAWAAVPALAASLALAVVLTRPGAPGPGYADAQLASALDDQLVASQPAGAQTRVLLSFADKQGDLCRAFAGAAKSGIACRDDRGWRIAKTLGGGAAEMGEYRQAGSPDAALMAAAQDMAAGPALDATQELAAKAKGWRE